MSRARQPAPPGAGADTAEAPFLLLNRQRKLRVDRKRILAFLERLESELNPAKPFTVVLVSDRVIAGYNRTFRNQEGTTDVLSFPGDSDYLGDILISLETAYNQSLRSATLSLDKNVERLALHGLLHLMGYDHETDNGEMKTLETRLRRRFRC